MELPTRTTKILSVFSREDLIDLDDRQFEFASELFNKYKHIFAKDDYDLGCASNTHHVLDVGNHPPTCSRPHCRSPKEESVISDKLNKLLDSGMIVPSSSLWASPILIVKKKDGSNCVVID